MIFLGFDTSNYTTSVAASCGDKEINIRKLLDVKTGERGLRQSDAVFQHMKQLPFLFSELTDNIDIKDVKAIGVSTRPRSIEGSYMPVFLQGEGYAKVCAKSLDVPLYTYSHQDGHIMAGIKSAGCFDLLEKPFISVHLSGGTCEILKTEYNGKNFDVEIIGGTKDISAGQLIDRVGVKLGLAFPCGKEMEKISKATDNFVKLPINAEEEYINFSGIETKALSLVGKEKDDELIRGLFIAISKAIAKVLENASKKYKMNDVLLCGGVISNSIIKEYLQENLKLNINFASKEYSCDNACGISILTKMQYEKEG